MNTKIHCFNHTEIDSEFFKEILNSKLILISYDCDFNFEPCKKNGKKAHWALITGFLLPINIKNDSNLNSLNDRKLLNLNNNDIENIAFSNLLGKIKLDDETCVICRHGKSKHSAIWNLNRLLESNRQLKFVDEDKCNENNFVLPFNGNIEESLSSKALIFT